MKLGRTTKIQQNFFVPSAHSIILDTSVSSLYGSTRLSYLYPHRSRLLFLFSPIDYHGSTRPPSFSLFVPAHCASSTSSSYSSFHLICCFDSLSTVQVSHGLLFPPVWGFLLRPPLQVRFVALFV